MYARSVNTLSAKKLLSSRFRPKRIMPGAGLEPASPFGRRLLRPPDFTHLSTRAPADRSPGGGRSLVAAHDPDVELRGAERPHEPDP